MRKYWSSVESDRGNDQGSSLLQPEDYQGFHPSCSDSSPRQTFSYPKCPEKWALPVSWQTSEERGIFSEHCLRNTPLLRILVHFKDETCLGTSVVRQPQAPESRCSGNNLPDRGGSCDLWEARQSLLLEVGLVVPPSPAILPSHPPVPMLLGDFPAQL